MDSANNLKDLNVISDRSPERLVAKLQSLQYGAHLYQIVVNNNKWYAFIQGNVDVVRRSVKVEKAKPTKTIKD